MPYKHIMDDRRSRGVCTECGLRLPLIGSRLCVICTQQQRVRSRSYRDQHRNEHNQRERTRRQWRKENKRCIRCGGPMDPDELARGYSTCSCNSDRLLCMTKNHPY